MNHDWLKVLPIAAVLLAGCGHQRPRLASAPDATQFGCFALNLTPYAPKMHWGGDEVFIEPPELLELSGALSTEPFARESARTLRPLGPSSGHAHAYGEWWPVEDGGIRLVWGSGFSGVEVLLAKTQLGYRGTARTFWDFGRPSQTATASMWPVSCEVAAEPRVAADRDAPGR